MLAVTDPDFQISGGGGGRFEKIFSFGPQFGLKIRRVGLGPPGPSPGSATATYE